VQFTTWVNKNTNVTFNVDKESVFFGINSSDKNNKMREKKLFLLFEKCIFAIKNQI